MVTLAASDIVKPVTRLNLFAVHFSVSTIQINYRSALMDPHWRTAIFNEYKALLHNNNWCLIPRPSSANIVTSKWIFKHKFHSNGTLARDKMRWVVRGYSQ